ncbi:hypothetical protein C8F04DRAFT_1192349 [Mycena alexandri]|uniref:Uncharacterized protein n=1 Tax=Mycena alexandri TaxID=1745969 RepID=A0AAD6SFJ4_9AGAR|nr:hypothetical protein C8F04DRAFT_1192349 [Mycena alexandri]
MDAPVSPPVIVCSRLEVKGRFTVAQSYTRPSFPTEILAAIFSDLSVREDDYGLSEMYRDRASLMRASSDFRAIVSDRASLWSSILVDDRTRIEYLRYCLLKTRAAPFDLEIRAADPAAAPAPYASFALLVAAAMELIAPAFSRCISVQVSCVTSAAVSAILESFVPLPAATLSSLSFSYKLHDYFDYDPEDFNELEFEQKPSFKDFFPAARAITIVGSDITLPTVEYTSSDMSEARIICPWDDPPNWVEFLGFLATSDALGCLVLDGFECAHLPAQITIPTPLMTVTSLVLAFRGCRGMAALVTRLVLPVLVSVKFIFEDEVDIECAAECRAILATASEVVMAGTCSLPHGLGQLFRLMFRVHTLDLSGATTVFWDEFRSVCNIRSHGIVGPNRYACPRLRHVVAPFMALEEVKRTLQTRRLSKYAAVTSVTMARVLVPFVSLLNTALNYWAVFTFRSSRWNMLEIANRSLRIRLSMPSFPPIRLDRLATIPYWDLGPVLTRPARLIFVWQYCFLPYLHEVPVEIVTIILLYACGLYFDPVTGRDFERTRFAIQLTCHQWNEIVKNVGDFWFQYYFLPFDIRSRVLLWTSRFRRGLDLRLRFEDYLNHSVFSGIVHPSKRIFPFETITALIPHLPSCKHLSIAAEELFAFPMLVKSMVGVDGSVLEFFTLERLKVPDLVSSRVQVEDLILFMGNLPRLVTLRLQRASIGWKSPGSFTNIVSMMLDDISGHIAPTRQQLGRALAAAVRLRRLSMSGVALAASVDGESQLDFVVPSLVELNLCLGQHSEMAWFIRDLCMPLLEIFTYQISRVKDLLCIMKCRPLLASIQRFNILSPIGFTAYLSHNPWERANLIPLFRLLPSVRHLDMCRAGPYFFPALLDAITHGPVCPFLNCLTLCEPYGFVTFDSEYIDVLEPVMKAVYFGRDLRRVVRYFKQKK